MEMNRLGSYAGWAVLPLVIAEISCTALAHVGVTYRECVPSGTNPYVEKFEMAQPDLVDRCWKTDQAPASTKIFTADGDLIVQPPRGLAWSATTQAPMFFRVMSGDFVVVTRAEATSTFQADHCLNHAEAAGLVVRRKAPVAWATLLVSPYFDPMTRLEVACKDEAANPPTARAEAKTFGFPESKQRTIDGIGTDAEAYIALCRRRDQLAYYYRVDEPKPNEKPWQLIHQHAITSEPVDVGATTSGETFVGEDSGMEGHFPWMVFYDYSIEFAADGCDGALETFVAPEGH